MKLDLRRFRKGLPAKPEYRIGWTENEPTKVRWECNCRATGRWRARTTTENKLKRLWYLHVKKVHGETMGTRTLG